MPSLHPSIRSLNRRTTSRTARLSTTVTCVLRTRCGAVLRPCWTASGPSSTTLASWSASWAPTGTPLQPLTPLRGMAHLLGAWRVQRWLGMLLLGRAHSKGSQQLGMSRHKQQHKQQKEWMPVVLPGWMWTQTVFQHHSQPRMWRCSLPVAQVMVFLLLLLLPTPPLVLLAVHRAAQVQQQLAVTPICQTHLLRACLLLHLQSLPPMVPPKHHIPPSLVAMPPTPPTPPTPTPVVQPPPVMI